MIAGNLLQQFYNIADTLIVGRVLGRNALAYFLSASIGVIGIWISIPIGWFLADVAGLLFMRKNL